MSRIVFLQEEAEETEPLRRLGLPTKSHERAGDQWWLEFKTEGNEEVASGQEMERVDLHCGASPFSTPLLLEFFVSFVLFCKKQQVVGRA